MIIVYLSTASKFDGRVSWAFLTEGGGSGAGYEEGGNLYRATLLAFLDAMDYLKAQKYFGRIRFYVPTMHLRNIQLAGGIMVDRNKNADLVPRVHEIFQKSGKFLSFYRTPDEDPLGHQVVADAALTLGITPEQAKAAVVQKFGERKRASVPREPRVADEETKRKLEVLKGMEFDGSIAATILSIETENNKEGGFTKGQMRSIERIWNIAFKDSYK